jgi:hypothetical protein
MLPEHRAPWSAGDPPPSGPSITFCRALNVPHPTSSDNLPDLDEIEPG